MTLDDILSSGDEECDHPLMDRFRNPPIDPFLAALKQMFGMDVDFEGDDSATVGHL